MARDALPYLVRACAACKEKKLRCDMNDGPPWCCQRCADKTLPCVIPETRPRKLRRKGHEQRLARLERRVDGVIAKPHRPRPSAAAPLRAASSSTEDVESCGTAAPRLPLAQGALDILSAAQADLLVDDYRTKFAARFPFVVLPDGADAASLQRTSPMLLLAILVTATWSDSSRLGVLNRHFLQTLSSKLFIEGTRDLDLLNGLLVYLNWLHLHMVPGTQQVYRLVSFAMSMAIDYGITRRPGKGTHRQMNMESVSEIPQGQAVVDAEFWSVEARRAYLGCYHMGVWFSICIRKAIPLPYDDYLSQCAKSLAETKAAPSDGDLVALLRFTREAETVYTLFNYSETHQTQYMSDEQIHIYLNVFSARLQDWQTDSASLMSRSSETLTLGPYLFNAFVREVSLSGISRNTDISVFRIRVIVDALENIRRHFDAFLALPQDRRAHLPAAHWVLLGYAVLLAATMSSSMHTPRWSVVLARAIIKLDVYIDALSASARQMSAMITPSHTVKDWFATLLVRWDAIKAGYMAALEQAENAPQAAENVLQQPGAIPAEPTAASFLETPVEPWPNLAGAPPTAAAAAAATSRDVRPLTMADGIYNSNVSLELPDFASQAGSWFFTDFDMPWYGSAGF